MAGSTFENQFIQSTIQQGKERKIISINVDNALDKIQHTFMIGTHRKLVIEGNFLIFIKNI